MHHSCAEPQIFLDMHKDLVNENCRSFFSFIAASRWLGFRLDAIVTVLLMVSTFGAVAMNESNLRSIQSPCSRYYVRHPAYRPLSMVRASECRGRKSDGVAERIEPLVCYPANPDCTVLLMWGPRTALQKVKLSWMLLRLPLKVKSRRRQAWNIVPMWRYYPASTAAVRAPPELARARRARSAPPYCLLPARSAPCAA